MKRESDQLDAEPTPKRARTSPSSLPLMPLPELTGLLIDEYLPADAVFALALTCRQAYARERPSLGAALAGGLFYGHTATVKWIMDEFVGERTFRYRPEDGVRPLLLAREDARLEVWAGCGEHPPSYDWAGDSDVFWPARFHLDQLGERDVDMPVLVFTAMARRRQSTALIAPWLRYVKHSYEERDLDLVAVFYALLRTGNVDHAATFHGLMTTTPGDPLEDVGTALYHAAWGGVDMLRYYWCFMLPGWECGDADKTCKIPANEIYRQVISNYWTFGPTTRAFFRDRILTYVIGEDCRRLDHPPLLQLVNACQTNDELMALIEILYQQCCTTDVRGCCRAISSRLQDTQDTGRHHEDGTWTVALLELIDKRPYHRAVWEIAKQTAETRALHWAALAPKRVLPVLAWRRIHCYFPYRYLELPGQCDAITGPCRENLLNWLLAVEPVSCLPMSIFTHLKNRLGPAQHVPQHHPMAFFHREGRDASAIKPSEVYRLGPVSPALAAALANPRWHAGSMMRHVLLLRQQKMD